MDCIELSINDISEKCGVWAEEIAETFCPQLLIYVAKAGYLIAEAMNGVFHAEILGIEATRKGNKAKEKLGFIFRHVPRFLHKWLISLELKSNIHGKEQNRQVRFHNKIEQIRLRTGEKPSIRKILIVDDSVDTGYSMKAVVTETEKYFPEAQIKIASMNVWGKSSSVIPVDFALYHDTIIKAPMSKDHKEYKVFKNLYSSATDNGRI